MLNLQEVTGHESGAIIFEGGDIIICNWSDCDGIPRLDPFGYGVIGLGEELEVIENVEVGNCLDELPDNGWLIFDRNDDINDVVGPGKKYVVECGDTVVSVIVPEEWN
jgi:hypothetical protein